MRFRLLIVTGGLVLAAMSLTACGGGSSGAASASPASATSAGSATPVTSTTASAESTTPVTSSSASTATSPVAAAGSTALDVCSAVPAATAAQLLGKSVSSAANSVFTQGAYQCTYQTDVLPINVIVFEQGSNMTLDDLKVGLDGSASKASPVVAVSGVGDQAFVGADGLIAAFGNQALQIDGSTDDVLGNHAGTIALAKAVIASLK
jgi:hypothetical protein